MTASDPTLPYWHLWADEEGTTRQTRCDLTAFDLQSMGGKAEAQWNDQLVSGPANLLFAVLPAGWTGDWHRNPEPQWITVVSGRWFVESMDGTRVEMRAGEVAFGGDQNSKPDKAGRVGHCSGTVGEEPCRLMIVQIDPAKWSGARPGAFK